MTSSRHLLLKPAVAALVLATALWGLTFPLVAMSNRLIADHQAAHSSAPEGSVSSLRLAESAAFFLTVRFVLALAVLACVARAELRDMSCIDWLRGMATGLAFAIGVFLQTIALSQISPARSGFLTSLGVLFTPLLALAIGRERPSISMAAGALVACTGAAVLTGVVSGPWSGSAVHLGARSPLAWGDVLTILTAAAFSVQIILIDTFSRRMPAQRLTPGMFLATALGGAVAFAVCVSQPQATSLHVWIRLLSNPGYFGLALFLGIACTMWPFWLMNKYQPLISPTHAALIYALEPVFATLAAVLLPELVGPWMGVSYPAENITPALVIGGCLLLAANVFGARGCNGHRA